ncbi:MAG: YXWGXW repeat-containing protein [Isosphaeraceae bacterium]|nr:YXWGXW repeat-containing protein [Isosphaeraceae bacterium]
MWSRRAGWTGVVGLALGMTGWVALAGENPAASSPSSSTTASERSGPQHEALLDTPRERGSERIAKAPPAPIVEQPGAERPGAAQWIEGYWDWDAARQEYVWVTGIWRLPPPGRHWIKGAWTRDEKGWYRVPGFWSDRPSDQISYRKQGPPAERPAEEPGPAPGPDRFYVPGQFYPEGDGIVWKKGFWAKAQPGWVWVAPHWIRREEGWVFQEGYWDYPPEERGGRMPSAFAAGTMANAARRLIEPHAPSPRRGAPRGPSASSVRALAALGGYGPIFGNIRTRGVGRLTPGPINSSSLGAYAINSAAGAPGIGYSTYAGVGPYGNYVGYGGVGYSYPFGGIGALANRGAYAINAAAGAPGIGYSTYAGVGPYGNYVGYGGVGYSYPFGGIESVSTRVAP